MDLFDALFVSLNGQSVDDIRQIVPEAETDLSSLAKPERCPFCGALPRFRTVINDTTMFYNTFVVGATLSCPDCSVVHAQAFGEYALIYPTGEVRPLQNAVRMVIEDWNHEVRQIKENWARAEAEERCEYGENHN